MPRKRLVPATTEKPKAKAGRPIVIVGVGHMGGAFARGLIAAGLGSRLILIDPALKPSDARAFRAQGAQTGRGTEILDGTVPEAIILAVKPQMMAASAPAYVAAARKAVVISIAAGTSIESLDAWLEQPPALVRAMPNLPASLGKGISAAYASPGATAAQRKLVEKLLKAVGEMVWLDREELLNAVTAVSGSGPAYVFLFVEALATAAERAGLSPDVAKILARKTVEGAAALLSQSTASPSDLRKSVTSPGGTTEAALKILMNDARFEQLVSEAVAAATARGFEIAKSR
ncbi:MAG: pyrroline-5-carboxylate reductase [Alphaproteobacteria bacterium]|nr:pyrroline-5-carboxylate reductase [Alphaproteobacteria bacterium]